MKKKNNNNFKTLMKISPKQFKTKTDDHEISNDFSLLHIPIISHYCLIPSIFKNFLQYLNK